MRISIRLPVRAGRLGGVEQPVQQVSRLADGDGVLVVAVLCDEQPHQGEVLELVQVAGVGPRRTAPRSPAQSAASDSLPCWIRMRAFIAAIGRTSG